MTRRLGLVQISDTIANNFILPLAIGVLWQSASAEPMVSQRWSLHTVIARKEMIADCFDRVMACDMVCFSTYIWNADQHVELARRIKAANPNCMVVFGGPHFTPSDQSFLRDHADTVDLILLGEGESSFQQLLAQWPESYDPAAIPGAWTKHIQNEIAPRVTNLEHLPSPFLHGFYDQMIADARNRANTVQVILQTNRGCPYHCTFCEEGDDYKNKLYLYDLDRIKREIEWCGQNRVEFLSIGDDNFGIVDRDIEIMDHLCQVKKTYGYPQILDTTFAKNNMPNVLAIAKLDKSSGTDLIRGITMSLQSDNVQTLDNIKRFNLAPSRQIEMIERMREIGMPVYSELIWPLPHETFYTFCQGFDSIISRGIDNWIGLYPLGIPSSTALHAQYRLDYEFATPSMQDDTETQFHFRHIMPYASRWASHEQVVAGHVMYTWLTATYFFGFARAVIGHMYADRSWSVTQTVREIMQLIDHTHDHALLRAQHEKLKDFWSRWLKNSRPPDLNQFPGQDVDFWYPYTHHASWMSAHETEWLHFMRMALRHWELADDQIDLLLWECEHGVVKHQHQYPYVSRGKVIDLNHTQPFLSSAWEFCRYYFWWNRKKGLCRTVIKC